MFTTDNTAETQHEAVNMNMNTYIIISTLFFANAIIGLGR
jgi:hypothetical protein